MRKIPSEVQLFIVISYFDNLTKAFDRANLRQSWRYAMQVYILLAVMCGLNRNSIFKRIC